MQPTVFAQLSTQLLRSPWNPDTEFIYPRESVLPHCLPSISLLNKDIGSTVVVDVGTVGGAVVVVAGGAAVVAIVGGAAVVAIVVGAAVVAGGAVGVGRHM